MCCTVHLESGAKLLQAGAQLPGQRCRPNKRMARVSSEQAMALPGVEFLEIHLRTPQRLPSPASTTSSRRSMALQGRRAAVRRPMPCPAIHDREEAGRDSLGQRFRHAGGCICGM